jgi:hypothetical protein
VAVKFHRSFQLEGLIQGVNPRRALFQLSVLSTSVLTLSSGENILSLLCLFRIMLVKAFTSLVSSNALHLKGLDAFYA